MLERDAPYVQIIEHYRQEIRTGRLQDGDMLPSGREIAQQFGVSLATAAKVATGLQALGLVTPRPGAGTMVTAPRPPADRARGGPLLITLASRTPARPGDKARVLEAGLVQAPQTVAAQLGVEPHDAGHPAAAGHRPGRASTAAVLTSWFPAVARRGRAGPAAEDAAGRGDQRLPAGLGRGLGIGPAADLGRGPGVRHQARLTGRRGAQPPVRRRRRRHRVLRARSPAPTPASSTATPSAHSSAPSAVIPAQVQVTDGKSALHLSQNTSSF